MDSKPPNISAIFDSLGQLSAWVHASKRLPIHDDITMHQASALYHIMQAKTMPVGDLAKLMQASPAATTAIVSHLERHGLVERVIDHADRRRILVSPTDKAEDVWPQLAAEIDERAGSVFKDWSATEVTEFNMAINKLLENGKKVL